MVVSLLQVILNVDDDAILMQTGMQIILQHLLIRHTLDVMHNEKNICQGVCVVWFIFDRRDTNKVQHNMQVEGIWQHLWLRQHPNNQDVEEGVFGEVLQI